MLCHVNASLDPCMQIGTGDCYKQIAHMKCET
jgi:hypothetical protein